MLRVCRVLSCLTFVMPALVSAGGSYHQVRIDSIVTDGVSFVFVAKIIDGFSYDSSVCETIEVSGTYDAVMWKNYTNLINDNIHLESLKLLKIASTKSEIINFGYIGAGLHKTTECKYESKGLFHNQQGVFSIYGRI